MLVQQPAEPPSPKKRFSFSIPFRSKSASGRKGSVDSNGGDRPQRGSVDQPRKLRKSFQEKDAIISVQQRKSSKTSTLHEQPSVTLASSRLPGYERDTQTGELKSKDHTDMLHSLAHEDEVDENVLRFQRSIDPSLLKPGNKIISRLPPSVWSRILKYLDLSEEASLGLSCKGFQAMVDSDIWRSLEEPENFRDKISFLVQLNKRFPNHLLCFPCGKYHIRTQAGQELLKPANVANHLFDCPHMSNPDKKIARTRITFGRTLPFPFVQLVHRHERYSQLHGMSTETLNRRYKDREGEWSHQTRFTIVNGHLLMRVISTTFAPGNLPPAGLRHLLYSRDDFVPYFSVCAHWRDGDLMPAVKCALNHIPGEPSAGWKDRPAENLKYRMNRPDTMVTQCSVCKPMRRCPDCPTEYLIEIKLQEDRSEKDPRKLFKQALTVTRWSDLGDGSTPWSPEWAAVNGEAEFDSFTALGNRAISGTFESLFNIDQIPGQRIISMNPNNEKLGEAGHNWY